MKDVKEVHTAVCRHVPSKGGWTYEGEVSSPSNQTYQYQRNVRVVVLGLSTRLFRRCLAH